jgi:4-amino-4-deoxy-L-arabinose transferase-like glycosyltransferase
MMRQPARHLFQIQIALLLILLIGFAARIYDLDRQSMWSDEGLSYYRAGLPPAEILQNTITIDGTVTRDTNPPLYFLLLNLWRRFGGESVSSLRLAGALASWLAVPLMFVLGTTAYDEKVGLTAALLMAISPFDVWQSQVLRNYGLLVTLNLFAVYGLVRFALASEDKGNWRWLALWGAASLLGIYTHYFGFLIFAFGLLVLTVVFFQRYQGYRRLGRSRLLGGLGLVFLLVGPATLLALDRFRQGQQFDFFPVPLGTVIHHAASAFGVGVSPSLTFPWTMLLPAIILFLAGLAIGLSWRPKATLIIAGYQIIPLGLLLLLSLINPLYNGVRHLLIGLPPFLLLVATGIAGNTAGRIRPFPGWQALLQATRIVLALLVLIIQLLWLQTQFTSPRLLRDDVRAAAQFLNAVAKPGDRVILHDTLIGFVFDVYYEGDAPWSAIPLYGEADAGTALERLAQAGEAAQRIWFLRDPTPRTGFPVDVLPAWAEENWLAIYDKTYPRMWLKVHLDGYDPDPLDAEVPEDEQLAATFGDTWQLHGVEIPGEAKAGMPWWITWYWSRQATPAENELAGVELSLRLFDENGRQWHQTESALGDKFPAAAWPEGVIVRFDQQTSIPAGLPPGHYTVELRLLHNGSVLPADDGSPAMTVGSVQVIAAAKDAEAASQGYTVQNGRLGPVELLGYRLTDSAVKPGHVIPVDLLWQVRTTAEEDLKLRLRLLNEQGEAIAESMQEPTPTSYPSQAWQKGDVLRAQGTITVPAAAEAGAQLVEAALVSAADGRVIGRPLLLDQPLEVSLWPLLSEPPAVDAQIGATFGNPPFAALAGVSGLSLPLAPGEVAHLQLVWQGIAPIQDAYSVFVHVTDETGAIVAQQDGTPAGGVRPTSSWRTGEVIIDDRELFTGADMAPGEYDVWLGFYDPDSGVRPAAFLDSPSADGRVRIGVLTIEES